MAASRKNDHTAKDFNPSSDLTWKFGQFKISRVNMPSFVDARRKQQENVRINLAALRLVA